VRSPISGKEIALRELRGAEELLLLAGHDSVPALARELLTAVAGAVDDLPVGDGEALLLEIRRAALGETISATVTCPAEECQGVVDISFAIGDYLAHHRPRRVPHVRGDAAPWLVERSGIAFRLPTLRDQVDVSGAREGDRDLLLRCLRAPADAATQRKVQTIMERMAPTLSDYVGGACPMCGTRIEVYFDVEQFVLRELRDAASFLHEEIHLIASRYGWSEADIVALPRGRRTAYATHIRAEGAAA
jgi:hypothetical protein